MKKSLATILGFTLGSAVAYAPFPCFAQTPKELEVYEEAAKDAEKARFRRAFDLEYAEIARIVVKDPASKKILIKDYLGSCNGKVLILPQTCLKVQDDEKSRIFDWLPFIKEASNLQKVVVLVPSIPQADLRKSHFSSDLDEGVETLVNGLVQAGIKMYGTYAAPPGETSVYNADLAEGQRIKYIQSNNPGKIIIIVGENLNRFIPSTSDEEDLHVGPSRAYQDAGLSPSILFPVDHRIDSNIASIISERKESVKTHPSDEFGPDVNSCVGEVSGFLDGSTIYIPTPSSDRTK